MIENKNLFKKQQDIDISFEIYTDINADLFPESK